MAVIARPNERSLPRRGAVPIPRFPTLLVSALLLAAVGGVGLLQVFQTSRAASMGYELTALERERAQLSAEVRLLEADIAQAIHVDHIRQEATTRLGMVRPEQTLQVHVGAPAPRVVPLPERYVAQVEAPPAVEQQTWWQTLLRNAPWIESSEAGAQQTE